MMTLRGQYPLVLMCRVFEVSRSGYHAWTRRRPSKRAQETARWEVAIQAAHACTRQTDGPERLQEERQDEGGTAGVGRITRLRKKLGLRCKQVRTFKATTNSAHDLPVAANLLDQHFQPDRPNEAWGTDLTDVPTDEGWRYLAGIKDLYACELVGCARGERMTKALVGRALVQAVSATRPPAGLIHHADRGRPYCARDYQDRVRQFGMTASMSRKGTCYDHAPMESFWCTSGTM